MKFRKTPFIIFLLLLVIGSVVYINHKSVARLLVRTGLIKTSIPDFFTALETQNLLYDYNNDGAVTGEDYSLVVKEADKKRVLPTPTQEKETGGPAVKGLSTETEAAAEHISLPSVMGTGSDAFTGVATTSYPIELPPAPAGLVPSVSLNYSSGAVDDLFTGIETKWRNDAGHPYQKQAGIVGFGWNLSSGGYISRDVQGTLNDPSDDTFILGFGGGSANLTKESGDNTYSVWRTVPNLKTRVERFGLCKTYQFEICRYHWKVTTADGTKYFFGGSAPATAWRTTSDPDVSYFPDQGLNDSWYPLGYSPWLIYGSDQKGWHALVYQWQLSKVENVYNLNIEYSYQFGLLGDYQGKKYVSAVYPYKINYGQNEVEFVREPRFDYKTHQGDNTASEQPFQSKDRIRKILIRTSGKVIRAYVLEYKYGWVPSQHYDTNGNGIPDSIGEVKDGQVIHSLLQKITPWSGDPG